MVLVSATMPGDILDLSKKFMNNPAQILVNRDELTLEKIRQFFYYVGQEQCKFDALMDLCEVIETTQAVIFCRTKDKVDWVAWKLKARGFTTACFGTGS